jgi:hypothetical protein
VDITDPTGANARALPSVLGEPSGIQGMRILLAVVGFLLVVSSRTAWAQESQACKDCYATCSVTLADEDAKVENPTDTPPSFRSPWRASF